MSDLLGVLLTVPSRRHRGKAAVTGVLLLAGATAAVAVVGKGHPEFADLAYAPILLWAFWFGVPGGLAMAAGAAVLLQLYGPPRLLLRDPLYWTFILYGAFGAVGGAVSALFARRLARQMELLARLDATRGQLAAIVEGSGVAIVGATTDGVVTTWNAAAERLLGYRLPEILGQHLDVLVPAERLAELNQMRARLNAGGGPEHVETNYRRKDGGLIDVLISASTANDETGEVVGLSVIAHDNTHRKRLETELNHQALHDSLTGLPNRALLGDRLAQGLALSRRRRTPLGVMFLDVDNFKAFNDSLGHTYGDELLRHVARLIEGAIRPSDTVARFGGDEFVVVCEDADAAETEEIAQRVLESLSQPARIGEQDINITSSVGITMSSEGATPETLLQEADLAMYSAKHRGAGSIHLFDEGLRSQAEERLATAAALHWALARREFTVYYQPIIDISTGELVSAEALARWEHPSGLLVQPDDFIPIAEETGLIVPIGAWVLEQACQELVIWRRSQPSMSLAVNLSVRQLMQPDLVDTIEDTLLRYGAPASSLCLELTESAFLEDAEHLEAVLTAITALGAVLAIDDFGTGYSSLLRLKRLPVDAVKVDRKFVDGLGPDPHDTALVTAIVAMAHALDLRVIAEGVESLDQLRKLKALGCTRAQGFYLARPMPAAAMSDLVIESRHWQIA